MTVDPGLAEADAAAITVRPSIDGYRLPALDAMRAVGAFAVLLTHVGFQTGAVTTSRLGGVLFHLDVGVAIFFVLSGLLLVIPWADQAIGVREAPSVRGYYWRRALRILPAYWVVALVALASLPENAQADASTWVNTLTLTQTYQPLRLATGLTQMWSLATEASFYLVLPLLGAALVVLVRRAGLRAGLLACGAMTALSVAWLGWLHTQPSLEVAGAGLWLPGYLAWFGPGMAMGLLIVGVRDGRAIRAGRLLREIGAAPWAAWVLAAGVFLVATTPVAGPRTLNAFPSPGQAMAKAVLYGLVAFLLVVPAAFGGGTRAHRGLTSGAAAWLGRVSYGVFLWHLVVLWVVMRALGLGFAEGGFWRVLGLTLPLSLVAAWLSWVLVERPAQRLRHRVS